ncbi:hypothetical protein FT663_00130 [Candidozyma haemuli var. vulneris]|nr:hypothetical protein FT662_00029 [[Candida] haemuloni var. vulneris]KAF3995708.1 hypothetical protein FT663_00130 [[Candida] haemuloni var. vulneris]
MVEVSLTVGKLDASLALLLTKDHHLIEFPTILLPNGVKAGSIVKIRVDRDLETELEEKKQFQAIQDEIIDTFGKNLPKTPQLRVKNVTQTSCVLEWDELDLGTASLKNLVLFRDGKKLGAIPQALTNKTTKLSGLPIDKTFKFHLRLDTTAGVYKSEEVEVTTHKMTDLSGITVCLGDITPNDQFTVDDIQAALKNMGAHHPAQETVKVDTTHYITTRENKQNPEFVKANDMNIPIIRPEWLKACERERRIVGVRDFYVKDCSLPDILGRDYWKKGGSKEAAKAPTTDNANLSSTPVVQVTSPSPDQSRDENAAEESKEEPKSESKEPEAAAEPTKADEPAAEEETKQEESAPLDTKEEVKENGDVEEPKDGLKEEPKEEPKVESTEEPKVESTEEPKEEPKEEPTEAPKEEATSEPTEEPKIEETPKQPESEDIAADTNITTESQPVVESKEVSGDLSEVDLNESNSKSGVTEHANLAEDLAKEEAKESQEAAQSAIDGTTEVNLDEDNDDDEGNEDDKTDDTADKSGEGNKSGSSKKKKNKKKNKK